MGGRNALHASERIRARLAADEAVKLRLDKSRHVSRTDAGNVLYAQSSRGPNPVLADILKPDVVAPGTDILGAQTSVVANGVRGESFQYLSGTSMAVPHVAGAAALLMEAHADWSPALIRSALVTTARADVQRDDGTTLADGFDVGAGYVGFQNTTASILLQKGFCGFYEAPSRP